MLYDFINYDDDLLVYGNPMVTHGVTAERVVWAFTANVVQHVVSAHLDLLHAG